MRTKKEARVREAAARPRGHGNAIDWKPIADAALDGAEWCLDRAAESVADFGEELAAIERVRLFVHAHLAGVAVPLDLDDLLLVMGLIIERLGRELGAIEVEEEIGTPLPAVDELARLRRALRSRPVVRRCPGAPSARRVRDPYIHAA